MRKIVAHMQTTLNSRIANADGVFWEPFPWGEEEQAYINEFFRAADILALSRVMYEAIVPWWDAVAAGELVVLHPAVLPAGPALFGGLTTALALELLEAKVFDAGCVVLRYGVRS